MASHYNIHITGIVQGVGFRPFVYKLACGHGIYGTVCNNSDGVIIDCSCSPDGLDGFVGDLQQKAPPVAAITSLLVTPVSSPANFSSFAIISSKKRLSSSVYVAPDLALCSNCQAELFALDDLRCHHPFINCTDCGSRYTIIRDTPYDRATTSMAVFGMCQSCETDYFDPQNRRFHAEPVCCPRCGPKCSLSICNDPRTSELSECGGLLQSGQVGAVKGCGGFQICCDALADTAIGRIRAFKQRPDKPFAIMARSLAEVKRLCYLSSSEESVLVSSACPIVLLRLKQPELVSPLICAGHSHIGVMLPTTGLHHLLFHYSKRPFLLMTSANRSGEPLILDLENLVRDLGSLLDFHIDHNRQIVNRIDDSVLMVTGGVPRFVRRGRGYVPQPITVPLDVSGILALGGQQKNCFALGRGHEAFMGPHIGTLGYLKTNEFLQQAITAYQSLLQLPYSRVVHDLHPTYETTRVAVALKVKALAVQHHHAHHASCMAENGLNESCIGIILDGSGYGDDGTIWGGEILLADFTDYKRLCHFDPVPLLGGEKALQYPLRMGLAYLASFLSAEDLQAHFGEWSDFRDMYSLWQNSSHLLTSSCGRLFDAVAALLGCLEEVTFEGQGAIMVEWLAERSSCTDVYTEVLEIEIVRVIPTKQLILAVYVDIGRQVSPADISRKFLNTLAALLLKSAELARQNHGVNKVVFSGGVFQNRILTLDCQRLFAGAGFKWFLQKKVPCNDGGLALGQLCINAARL